MRKENEIPQQVCIVKVLNMITAVLEQSLILKVRKATVQ